MKQKQIQRLFQQPYNQQRWKEFLAQTFTNARLYSTPDILADINTDVATQALQLGNIKLNENGIERNIAVYDVTLASGIVLERNRVGLRNLLRKFWKDIDGAFIVFHRDGVPSWRFTYVSELKGFDAEGEWIEIKTEPKRYTYVLGELESCRTASERFALVADKGSDTTLDDIKEAFSVEKLSKSFFEEYKRQYELFCEYMINQPSIFRSIFESDDKAVRDFTKKMLGRIVFLFFIQKKGWMGVPENEEWGSGDLDFLGKLFSNCKYPELFYSEYLCKLFFSTLNTKRPNDIAEIVPGKKVRIPFLNGGLFEEDNPKFRDLLFPIELFSDLFDFFNQYNFTIYEDDPNDQTVAVDPEILGHIFENLLEDNKDKGAFYTPKEIVHYMCQESLIEYLTTHFEGKGYEVTNYHASFDKQNQPELFPVNEGRKGQLTLEATTTSNSKEIDRVLIEKLLKQKLDDADKDLVLKHAHEFNKALDKVKICDPAIGSGAFPMGLLKEIFNAKQTLHTFKHGSTKGFDASTVKLNIIQNSIYGVDIEKGAVDIARLRFWLSLVVDEETPKALPNLDYKIVVGDSLVSKLGDDIIDIDWSINKEDNNLFGSDLVHEKLELLKEISLEQKEFFNPHSDKKSQAVNIRNLKIDLLINQLGLMIKTANQETKPSRVNFSSNQKFVEATELYLQSEGWKKQINKLQTLKAQSNKPLRFFDWKLDFPEVLNPLLVEEIGDEKTTVGFDIIIGNPPYVRQERISSEMKEILSKRFPLVAVGTADLYVYFFNIGLDLLKSKGMFIYITLNKFLKTRYGLKLRNLLSMEYDVDSIIDFFELPVFDASTDVCITKIINSKGKRETKYYPVKTLENLNLFEITASSYQKAIKDEEEWKFIDHSQETILEKIYRDTVTLKEICYDRIFRGITTGLNRAFVLENDVAQKLLNSESKGIVKPYAQSRDIKKWGLINNNRYFLATGFNLDIKNKYPTAYSYLLQYKEQLIVRQDQGAKWWNLRSCAYYEEFEMPKLIYMHTARKHEFFFDEEGRYINNSCYMIISDNKFLFYYLNSKLFEWLKKIKFVAYGDASESGRAKLDYNKMVTVPIKKISDEFEDLFEDKINLIKKKKEKGLDIVELEVQLDAFVYKLYELNYDEVKIIDPEFPLSKEEYDNLELK